MTYATFNETNLSSLAGLFQYGESITSYFGVGLVLMFWGVVFFALGGEPMDRRFTTACFTSAVVSFLFSALGVGNSGLGIIFLICAAIGWVLLKDATIVS